MFSKIKGQTCVEPNQITDVKYGQVWSKMTTSHVNTGTEKLPLTSADTTAVSSPPGPNQKHD
jgi:hypothetical protein